MDCKVTLSAPYPCPECNQLVRTKHYDDDEYVVQPDPIDDIPTNPVHELHAKYCKVKE